MTSSARFKINAPNVISETFDDEVIILNFDSGNYYSLDLMGAEIWGLIEKGASAERVIEEISSRYHGTLDDIENAVKALIFELKEKELIVPGEARGPETIPGADARPYGPGDTARPAFKAPVIREYTDMQELLLLDPIHEVDEAGWPFTKAVPPVKEE